MLSPCEGALIEQTYHVVYWFIKPPISLQNISSNELYLLWYHIRANLRSNKGTAVKLASALKSPVESNDTYLAVYIIIGACSSCRANKSPTVPPATLRKAAPATPSINLDTSIVAIFCATAQGISHMTKKENETIYIGLRPKNSDRGAGQ